MRVPLTLLLLATTVVDARSPETMDGYRIKAAFLYNFTQFVHWTTYDPADTMGSRFPICVLGRDPFGQALDDVVAGKAVLGRLIEIRRISDLRTGGDCKVLFIASSETRDVASLLRASKQVGTLTVGEIGTPNGKSSIIAFTLVGGKVRFEINAAAAEEGKINLSSNLVSLATVVRR